jgi:hypothetical protein
MLEDDVGRVAEEFLDPLREPERDLEARLLLVGGLAALAHHPGELPTVDVVDGAEALDELTLLCGGHDADARRARRRADLRREHAQSAGGAPDQHALPRLQFAARQQHPVGGEVHEPV